MGIRFFAENKFRLGISEFPGILRPNSSQKARKERSPNEAKFPTESAAGLCLLAKGLQGLDSFLEVIHHRNLPRGLKPWRWLPRDTGPGRAGKRKNATGPIVEAGGKSPRPPEWPGRPLS